jgi:hypothetical protein
MTPNNPNYSDLLNALSLILAVENLNENRQQSQYNDVHTANDKQAEYLLNEINNKFNQQNEILFYILKQVRENGEKLDKILGNEGE